MNEELNSDYWSARYAEKSDGWDLGKISTPIKEYIDQLEDKSISILIPGCGFGYEGEYLFQQGFLNVHMLDFSINPLDDFQKRNPTFPFNQLHVADFFQFKGEFDLIIEQTLFCAINPLLRSNYALKVKDLLKPKGKLVGLFFNREFEVSPPFGGTKEEYLTYFSPHFSTIQMEECYNSIVPRAGGELFIKISK